MKINLKLFLIEIFLSVIFFLTVLFSITSFMKYIAVENLRIKIATLEDSAARLRFSITEMTTTAQSSSYLVLEHNLYMTEMANNIDQIEEDKIFAKLSQATKDSISNVRDNFEKLGTFLPEKEMTSLLELRSVSPYPDELSLSALTILLRETSESSEDSVTALEEAMQSFWKYSQRSQFFEKLQSQALSIMHDDIAHYQSSFFAQAIIIPLIILGVSLVGIILFGNFLSRRLKILDTALIEVAGGNFDIRVEMNSKDEFKSLASSINAFTRTLGAKLESFQLIMHDIGQTLESSVDSTQVEETILKLTTRDSIADGAALYKVGGESGELVLSMIHGSFRPPFIITDLPESPGEEDIEAILRSRIIQPGVTILGESAVKGLPILIRDVENEQELDWKRPLGDSLYLSSIIVVPLQVGSTVFGVLAITSSNPESHFSDLEFANMQSFAELAAITMDNIYKYADLLEATQLNRELGIAEEIQQDLLPKRLPRIQGGSAAYLSRSIKGLNGDYFDVYPLGGGKTMITICEVAGRGVPAGLVMVMIRTILRLVTTSDKDAKTIMTLLNRDMTRRIAIENYASVGILVIDSQGRFTFSSAAHYPLQIHRNATSTYEAVQTEGIPVGIDKAAEYRQAEGSLHPNDIVIFHTDGIPESRNRDGTAFGIDSLLEIISTQSSKEPEDIIETLRGELEFFERGTEQKDDQTVIILKFKGESAA